MRQRATLLATPLLLASGACGSRGDDETSAQQPPAASTASARVATSVPEAVVSASTPTTLRASDGTDSMIIRARAGLHAAMPTFREWGDSSSTPVSIEDAGPGPFTSGPVVGDFDEDGTLDVAFIGYDAEGEHVMAVLSQRGHPAVVPVTSDVTVPASGPQHHRWMRVAVIDADRRRVGLEIAWRNETGAFGVPRAEHYYDDGHFTQWIAGD